MPDRTFTIHNLGCKVNSYEAEAVEELLKKAGYSAVPFSEKADIVIINTCTVTAIADKKSRQMLHRAKTLNPDAVVVAMGCYAETGKEKLDADDSVDIIIGNNRKKDIVPILDAWFSGKEELSWYADLSANARYEEMGTESTGEHTRAFIKIQDGCNRFCSYCIIPYARGRIRSRNREDVLKEVRRHASAGVREVVLTGIHLSSYGKDPGTDCDLITLIEQIAKIGRIKRIRLGSLEAGIIDEEFVRRLSAIETVCPHFHLSLQSGCDATLRRMNRSYTADEFYEKCVLIRQYFDRPALTTDIIAGFPGETEEEFEESYAFVKKVGFFETHIFPYSKREGTRAASMPDQIPEAVKKERVRRLLKLNELQRARFLESVHDEPAPVLFEEQEEKDGKIWWVGHTPRYEKVYYESEEDLKNRIVVTWAGAFSPTSVREDNPR